MTKQTNGELSLLEKQGEELLHNAQVAAEAAQQPPDAPVFEIDPDVDLSFQLETQRAYLKSLYNGRYTVRMRWRTAKFSFRNEQMVSEIDRELLVQEAAIADTEAIIQVIEAEQKRRVAV